MTTEARPPRRLLLAAGIVALGLLVLLYVRVLRWRNGGPRASLPASPRSTATASSTPTSIPSTAPATKRPATPSPTATPTPSPSSTPQPTATPTPTPVGISPPFVSATGALAYVDAGSLFVVQANGASATTVAEGVAHNSHAALWSPDGTKLLFASQSDDSRAGPGTGTAQINLWDYHEGSTLHLTSDIPGLRADAVSAPQASWSPEGDRLLFECSSEACGYQASVLDVGTRRVWLLPEEPHTDRAWLTADTILSVGKGQQRSSLLRLGSGNQVLSETVGLTDTFALSPDRRRVATFEDRPGQSQRLRAQTLPDQAQLPLPEQPVVEASGRPPLWSPDGRWLAYGAVSVASHQGTGPYTVLADTSGLSPTQVAGGLLPVAWSPDARLLAGFGCSEAACELGLVDAVTGETTIVASATSLRLRDLAWSPGGVYLAYSVGGSSADVDGLVVWHRTTGERQRLMRAGPGGRFTDLKWTPDGCILYTAQREATAEVALRVSAIWGIGPEWLHHWRVAPSPAEEAGGAEPLQQTEENNAAPLCPGPLLEGRRLIAYYGTPLGRGLGILGRHGITETLRRLGEQAEVYRNLDPHVETIPTFHMVTTIADGFPGPDGDYNHRVPHETIRPWIDAMRPAGGWSILDIQPGRGSLMAEYEAIAPLLLEPDVHLAVDPEFIVGQDQVPGEDLGQITGAQINWVQASLDQVARQTGQRKMLVIHQFEDRMVRQKEEILDYPLVDLVWDADGFGSPGSKVADYDQYRLEAGFEYGAIKIFYRYDEPLIEPKRVLGLQPPPHLVIYQ